MSRRPSERLSNLTSLRGLAAWWVVLYHFRDYFWHIAIFQRIFEHGYLAVDIFFVLSGFVLQMNYARYFSPIKPEGLRAFAVARFSRIYPLHFVMLCVFLLNVVAILAFSTKAELGSRYSAEAFLSHVLLVQDWNITSPWTWNIPSWSISAEFAAYLIFPGISLFATRLSARPSFSYLAALLIVALIALFFALSGDASLGSEISRHGVIRCVLQVSLGAITYNIYIQRNDASSFLFLLGSLSLFSLMEFVPDYVCFPAASVCLILWLALSDDKISSFMRTKFLLLLGEVSYSTYMVHFFIKNWVTFLLVGKGLPAILIPAIYVALVLGLSILFYSWIEVPSRGWIRRSLSVRTKLAQSNIG